MDVITRGDIAKYQIKVSREGFSADSSDVTVILSWGRFGSTLTIPSTAMYHDEEGRIFIFFNTQDMFGPVTAECRFSVPDSDMNEDEGKWNGLDRQVICYVEYAPDGSCRHDVCEADCSDREVHYARIFRADANTAYEILRDSRGNILLDNDGSEFRVRKSNLI